MSRKALGASLRETGSTRFAPEAPAGLRPTGDDPARTALLRAFTSDWQRLGDVAPRVNVRRGVKLITVARKLRADGLLESRYHAQNYQWRLTAIAMEARQGGNAEERSHAKHDSAGRKASPNPSSCSTGREKP